MMIPWSPSDALSTLLLLALLLQGCPGDGGGGSGGGSGSFAITTTTAPFGVVGSPYSVTLATTGGTAPFTWSLFGGALPAGLNLSNPATGAVTGTPTTPGNSTATFTVRDSNGNTTTGPVAFAVHPRTDRVSVDNNGAAGNGQSSAPSLNGDGSAVGFVSSSTNFISGVNGTQIYLHNRQNNQIELISRDNNGTATQGNGASTAPSISSDGRFVAFVSQATNLLAPATPAVPAGQQIYVRDRQTGITSLVSVDNNVTPNPGNGASSVPSINGDGTVVAFVSLATNLLAPGIPAVAGQQIYVRQAGITSLVSVDNNGGPNPGNGVSDAPSISGDGTIVAFDSLATNLLAPGILSVTGQQVYVRDRNLSQTSLVSADNNVAANPANGLSRTPSISSSGRFVSFVSAGTNLLAPGIPAVIGQQIYVRDRQLNQTNLASQDNSNTNDPGNGPSDSPSTNSTGGFVAFSSQASDLATTPPVALTDIYVRALP